MDLMKQIKIENNLIIEKIKRGGYTYFLNNKRIEIIASFLKKENIIYNIFYPFNGATYGIIYTNKPPASLLKINTKSPLTHSMILGSIMALNIKNDIIGDIIVDKNYYVVVMEHMKNYLINNLLQIGREIVDLEEVSFDEVKDYEIPYSNITITVSSLRIDVVIARIIGTSRGIVLEKFKNKEIFLNYNILNKINYNLKEEDVFSIRGYGKYKFTRNISKSKKDKYIIECMKYK